MKKYILAFDSGTTSVRCILFDKSGKICSTAQKEFTQIFPEPGWVEHDASEIWQSQLYCAREAIKNAAAEASEIAAIGITNQRETTVVWDRKTGKPVCNAIVWQCRRTGALCDRLRSEGCEYMIREKTGLVLDAYFSAPKIRWILDNVSGAAEKAAAGELCFGTVDSWLIWNMTGGKVHATDTTNACRTMLFNIHTGLWDDELCRLFGVEKSMLPEVRDSSGYFGECLPELFGSAIPICGAAGDQQSALFGQTCFEAGDVKNTYGTGCFMLMNTGDKPVKSESGLLTTVAWSIAAKTTYALEGSVFVAGAAIQWLRDELGIISSSAESEFCAKQAEDTGGCYFVPAFTGLGAPRWDQYARGIICGLTRGTEKNQIIRAALESIAYQSCDVMRAMEADSGRKMTAVRVDGGASANNFLMQFQADITDCTVIRPACVETTALGAAFLAGLSAGFWKGTGELAGLSGESVFQPTMSSERRESLLSGWSLAVRRALSEI